MALYLGIIIYITSVVIGVIVFFAARNISTTKFLAAAGIHSVFLILCLFSAFSAKASGEYSSLNRFSFLFFICSGVILSGLVWQSKANLILKIYFGLFAATLFLFLFSPSRMINFLFTAKYDDTSGKTFPVKENYFLEEQSSSMSRDDSVPHYKLIQKHGLFHETIKRDIVFKGILDSIVVLQFIHGDKTMIRGFTNKNTFVSSETDSADVELRLTKDVGTTIERKF